MQSLNRLIFTIVFLCAGVGSAHSADIFGLSEDISLHSESRRNLSQNEQLREALFDLAVEKTLVSFSSKNPKTQSHHYATDSRINLRTSGETTMVQYQLTF